MKIRTVYLLGTASVLLALAGCNGSSKSSALNNALNSISPTFRALFYRPVNSANGPDTLVGGEAGSVSLTTEPASF